MASYNNAGDILPATLLKEVQQYAEGRTLYIPVRRERQAWGSQSGAREALARRNEEIRRAYRAGASYDELAAAFYLSPETIRRLVRGCRRD